MSKLETVAQALQTAHPDPVAPWPTAILDLLPTPLLLIEPGTARVLFANKAADRMAGGTFPRDVPAEQYHTVYNCTDSSGNRIPDHNMPGVRVARGEYFEDMQMDWHLPDGTRSLLVQGGLIAPWPDVPAMAVVVFQDVTALKQAQTTSVALEQQARTANARIADMLDTITDGFLAFDREWRFTYLNHEGARTLNRSANDLIGKNLWQEFPDLAATSFGRMFRQAMEQNQLLELEDYYAPFDGWFAVRAYPTPSGLSIYFLSVTERHRAQQAQQFLANTNAVLSESLEYSTTFDRLTQLAVPQLADCCTIHVVEDGAIVQLAARHIDPAQEALLWELQHHYPMNPDDSVGLPRVISTSNPILTSHIKVDDLEAFARDDEHFALLQRLGLHSSICVPLRARGSTLGAITLMRTTTQHCYTEDDLRLASEFAHRAALAIDNARLYAAEQAARHAAEQAARRTERLQAVTVMLAEAITFTDIAEVIDVAVPAMDASAGSITLRSDDGAELELIRAFGYDRNVIEQFRRFPLDASLPIADAVRSGQPLWLESLADQQARFPNLKSLTASTGSKAIVVIPLYGEGQTIGALGLSFDADRTFTADDKAFMLTIAGQCALALERARLYGALHTALDHAQIHTAQLRDLTAASLSINGARSLNDVLQIVTEQARNLIGVHQAVASLTTGADISQSINTVVLSDRYEQWREYNEQPNGSGIYALVCETNTPMRLTQAELEAHPAWRNFGAHAANHPPIRGWLAAPLIGRDGRNIGVLQLSDKDHGDFTIEDEAVLVQLANIASVALENTRLYEEARIAERDKEEARALLDSLFATAPIGLAFFDCDLRYVRINEAMAIINGQPIEHHLGRTLQEVLPAIPPEVVGVFHEVLRTGEPVLNQEIAGWNPAEPGQQQYWLSSYYRVPGAEHPVGVGVMVQEISARKQAEISLRESEERYRTLFNSIDEGFCVIEMVFDANNAPVDYCFVEVNSMFEEQTGLRNAVGRSVRELVPGLEAHWFELYGNIALTGESTRFEQGSYAMNRWFDVYAFRLGDADSRKVAILFKDVSARKRTEFHQQFLTEASALLVASLDYETTLKNLARLVVPQLADWCAIDLLEEDGVITRVAVQHVDPDKVALAHDLRRRFPPDPNAPHGVAQVIRSGQPQIIPSITDEMLITSIHDPDLLAIMRGLGLRSSMVVPLITGGRVIGAITFVAAESGHLFDRQDIALAEDLAQRAAVAVDNARLYRAAQHAISARDEFLSIASHELKTPLTSLQLQAQTLLRSINKGDRDKLAPERLAAKFHTISQQTQRLTRLADDLLDVSRISMGRISFNSEELDVAEVVHEVTGRFEEQLRIAGCEMHVHAPTGIRIRSDRSRFEQILTNLLSNALKYGPGKPIAVGVDVDDVQVRIRVQDHGIGIAPEHLERIFIRFERAVSAQNYGGLGLGLYIVRQIVEALGGTISVQSTLDVGSTFTVALPRAKM